MATIVLPVRTDGYPHFDFDIELDGSIFNLEFKWNERDSAWYLTVLDADQEYIAAGIKVVTDWNLFRKLTILGRPLGELYAIDTTENGDPSRIDLGNRVPIVYLEATS